MPALQVTKNAVHLCTVGSAGLFMFSAGVWGDIWSKEVSHLDVTGGTEEEDGTTKFLMWEFLHELKTGDRLRFDFVDADSSSRRWPGLHHRLCTTRLSIRSPGWRLTTASRGIPGKPFAFLRPVTPVVNRLLTTAFRSRERPLPEDGNDRKGSHRDG